MPDADVSDHRWGAVTARQIRYLDDDVVLLRRRIDLLGNLAQRRLFGQRVEPVCTDTVRFDGNDEFRVSSFGSSFDRSSAKAAGAPGSATSRTESAITLAFGSVDA